MILIAWGGAWADGTWASGTWATTAAAASLGGRLIRSRRTRTPWWDEDEALAALCWALGVAPPERSTAQLRAAAKTGLTQLMQREPVAVDYAPDGALLLAAMGQQLRLTGALQRHVETLIDDQEVLDLIELIA